MSKLLVKLLDLSLVRNVLEGNYKHMYWDLQNKYSSPSMGCLCTMREECRTCYTKWQLEFKKK